MREKRMKRKMRKKCGKGDGGRNKIYRERKRGEKRKGRKVDEKETRGRRINGRE